MKDNLAQNIKNFLERNGIDPLYAVTLLGIIVLISYKKQIQDWNHQEKWVKDLIITTAWGTVLLIVINFLRLIGIIGQ